MSVRVTGWLERNSGLTIVLSVIATILLVIPFLAMQPTETASGEPGGEVFDSLVTADERFASQVYVISFIVEDPDGDLLRKDPLQELLTNEQAIRDDPEIGPKLFSYFDADSGADVVGAYTIADAVDALLQSRGLAGISAANDAQVRAAARELIDVHGSREFGLSIESHKDAETDNWIAPALIMNLLADNEALGGGGQRVVVGSDDTSKEAFSRDVQTRLRGLEQHFNAWGIAIDVNLTSNEQGGVAGPFIGFAILAVLLIVGIAFRSYWAVAVVGAALAAMIIWLKGLSNLIGLKEDLILSLIVPIAMISFGVDFAIHAVSRYREERRAGFDARPAFVAGLGAVMGALVLALISDAVAFLANVSSRIESVIQFGVGAVLGLVAAFVMLGVVTPARAHASGSANWLTKRICNAAPGRNGRLGACRASGDGFGTIQRIRDSLGGRSYSRRLRRSLSGGAFRDGWQIRRRNPAWEPQDNRDRRTFRKSRKRGGGTGASAFSRRARGCRRHRCRSLLRISTTA